MALNTQRCCMRSLLLRLPCLRVFALPTTRYALCGVPLAGVDLGPHDTLFIAEYLFGLCA